MSPSVAGEPNPSLDPARYPGVPVPGDVLLAGGWMWPMSADATGWTVAVDGGPLPRGAIGLDRALERLGAAPMAARRPVVAVGSNASAGQLAHKWPEGRPVPVTRVIVEGVGVGYSAHVSAAGYVPYAPYSAPGEVRELRALWLDERQASGLDATEPNYHAAILDARDVPARLPGGGALAAYGVYIGRWGVLGGRGVDGAGGAEPIAASGQAEAFAFLAGHEAPARLVPELRLGLATAQAALRADAGRRAAVREALREHAVGDGLTWRERER